MTHYYRIGSLTVGIESDIDLSDTYATTPFLCEECEAEIKLIFQGTDNLELPVGDVIFQNSSVRICKTDSGIEKLVFLPASDKYAAVVKETEYAFICRYNKEHSKYFSTVVNCFNAVGMEKILSHYDMFFLHCAFVVIDGKAVLFSGSAGIGKSTRAELLRKYANAYTVNQDKALLGFENNCLTAYGSPVTGSSPIVRNEKYPVEAIVFLEKGEINKTELCKQSDALKRIVKNTVINTWDNDFYQSAIAFATECVSSVKIYLSECNTDVESVSEQRRVLDV